MKRDKSFGANFSRRTLMTSAMAGAFTVAGHPAAAQRCPPIPPARVKGPLVWMNMDQQDVDEAYDNDIYAFNSKNVLSAKQRTMRLHGWSSENQFGCRTGQPRSNMSISTRRSAPMRQS